MEVSRARRLVELEKDGQKVLVTHWEGDKITTCVTAEEAKQACESCQGDDEMCNSYINYLQERGYQATEIELGEGVDLGLPSFLQAREIVLPPADTLQETAEDAITPAD